MTELFVIYPNHCTLLQYYVYLKSRNAVLRSNLASMCGLLPKWPRRRCPPSLAHCPRWRKCPQTCTRRPTEGRPRTAHSKAIDCKSAKCPPRKIPAMALLNYHSLDMCNRIDYEEIGIANTQNSHLRRHIFPSDCLTTLI